VQADSGTPLVRPVQSQASKRAAFLVALFVSILLGSCSPKAPVSTGIPAGYISAFDITHKYNLTLHADLATGVFRFTGDAEFCVNPGSNRALLNGRSVFFSAPVLLLNGNLMLPDDADAKLDSEISAKTVFVYSEKPTPVPTPTRSRPVNSVPSLPPSAQPSYAGTIVLDPGHGGADPGAIGPKTGITEKALNLAVAIAVRDILVSKGAKVIMTRNADVHISLAGRAQIANSSGADCFVSIHHNSTFDRLVKGYEVLYSDNNPNGETRLADSIVLCKAISSAMDGKWSTYDRGVKSKSLYVTRLTSIPSVLVEVEFLSCSELEPVLASDWFRSRAAESIANGILKYLAAKHQ